jgi:hypothetical protein
MKSPRPLDPPPLSDDSAADIHRFLCEQLSAFEIRYAFQLWRYYDNHPEQPRPTQFNTEPF